MIPRATPEAVMLSERLTMKDFLNAIGNNDFYFFYQPIYALKGDKLIGLEVLIRLNYKKKGLLLPKVFLEQAIACDMMTEVTCHLLDRTLSQRSFWASQLNEPLDITINLSIADIHSGVFTETLEKKMLEYKVEPSAVTIDISEEILEQDFEAVFEECHMLDKLGVKLAIDHFAKGSVTLRHLSMLPLHAIKIDGSVIEGMEKSEAKIRLISGIVSMGRKMGVQVGATFIETKNVKLLLERINCHFGQGNHLGEAMSPSDISHLIQSMKLP